MKLSVKLFLHIFLFCSSFLMAAQDSTFSVITFNLRYDNPADAENNWHYRKQEIADFIQLRSPEIFGIQEGLIHQLAFLDSALTRYQYVGKGRDDGAEKGEFSAIFFDTSKVALIYDSTFWLSLTPGEPSVGWDAALPRICTFARLVTKNSGDTLNVWNMHLDHMGITARYKSIALLVVMINDFDKALWLQPMIIMGDLNSTPLDDPAHTMLKFAEDTRTATLTPPLGPDATFNGFAPLNTESKRIDYIFVRNLTTIAQEHIDTKRSNGLWLSDHLPVMATLSFK